KEPREGARPEQPEKAIFSKNRPSREAAARRLAEGDAGRDFLRRQLGHDDARVRALALTALLDAGDQMFDLAAVANKDTRTEVRALAARALAARGADVSALSDPKQPAAVRREAIAGLTDGGRVLGLLTDPDPFLRAAAVERLAREPTLLGGVDPASL